MTPEERQKSAERIKSITAELSKLLTERGVEHNKHSTWLWINSTTANIENQSHGSNEWNQHNLPELKIRVSPSCSSGERVRTWRESVAGKGFPLPKIADFIKQCVDKANEANKEADKLREQNNRLRQLADESKIKGSLQMEYGLCWLSLRADSKIINTLTVEKLRKIEAIWKGDQQ